MFVDIIGPDYSCIRFLLIEGRNWVHARDGSDSGFCENNQEANMPICDDWTPPKSLSLNSDWRAPANLMAYLVELCDTQLMYLWHGFDAKGAILLPYKGLADCGKLLTNTNSNIARKLRPGQERMTQMKGLSDVIQSLLRQF